MVPTNMTRNEVARYLPPPGIWKWRLYKDLVNQRWQAFHLLRGTFSRSWRVRGEQLSATQVLQAVWAASLEMGEVSEIPYDFLRE